MDESESSSESVGLSSDVVLMSDSQEDQHDHHK